MDWGQDVDLCAEKCNATPECVGISIALSLGHCWLKVALFYLFIFFPQMKLPSFK